MFEDRDEDDDFEYHYSKIHKRDNNTKDAPNLPPLYSIHHGEVVSIKDFGAFVRLESKEKEETNERHHHQRNEREHERHRRDTERNQRAPQGLLHISEISKLRVENIREVLSMGEKVWVKVIKIAEDGKLSLSMRVVSQRDGKDLDPNNVELMLTEQKRKPFDPEKKKEKYQLEAILPTVCEKCKSVGHASYECWNKDPNSKYELIKEDDPILLQTSLTQNKNNRDEKSGHHHSHHHHGQNDSDHHHHDTKVNEVTKIEEITSREQALEILNSLNRLNDKEKKHKKHKKEKHKHKRKDKKDKEKRSKRHSRSSYSNDSPERDRRRSDRDLPIRKSYRYLESP